MSKVIRYLVFLSLGIGLLWWAYRDTPFSEILRSMQQANWWWVALAIVLNYTATVIRGARWNILLEPLGYRAPFWSCVHSVAFGYMMNDLVPRSGEFARCGLLNRVEKIPADKLFGTVVLERIVDIAMLGVMLFLAFVFKREDLSGLFAKVDGGKGYFLLVLLGIGIVGILMLYLFLRWAANKPWASRIVGFFRGMYDGFISVFRLRRKFAFLLYTIGIWGTWLVMTQVMMMALPETQHLGITDSIFLMVAASLAMLIPTQGGLGAYHFATREAFVVLGQTPLTGLAFAWISWTCKTILELVAGSIGFFVLTGKSKKATA
ncbi:MAG: flippase-like domain-containing protein [Flavobacteriales bacterium]|nr:flippase-like domain-containing protein [Flavobacteriales bacterium]